MRAEIRAEIINTPETADFMAAVPLEAAHQRQRWPSDHDADKAPEDWLFLVGYLAGKACAASRLGDTEKALHHTISTAAALANWHAALAGLETSMRPGIAPGEDRQLPDALPGHWDTAAGRDMAESNMRVISRGLLCKGEVSDFALANAVFLASREDSDLIVWQTAAKERIRWLSAQLAAANARLGAAGAEIAA